MFQRQIGQLAANLYNRVIEYNQDFFTFARSLAVCHPCLFVCERYLVGDRIADYIEYVLPVVVEPRIGKEAKEPFGP